MWSKFTILLTDIAIRLTVCENNLFIKIAIFTVHYQTLNNTVITFGFVPNKHIICTSGLHYNATYTFYLYEVIAALCDIDLHIDT